MQIEVNKEQLELLKYAILWYECNDKEEERIVDELETKLYNAQEPVSYTHLTLPTKRIV